MKARIMLMLLVAAICLGGCATARFTGDIGPRMMDVAQGPDEGESNCAYVCRWAEVSREALDKANTLDPLCLFSRVYMTTAFYKAHQDTTLDAEEVCRRCRDATEEEQTKAAELVQLDAMETIAQAAGVTTQKGSD